MSLARIDQALAEALELYGQGRVTEAVVLARRAVSLAIDNEIESEMPRVAWAAAFLLQACGLHRDALKVLLRIEDLGPDRQSREFVFEAKEIAIELLMEVDPDLPRLEERLADLERLGSKGDGSRRIRVMGVRASLLSNQGRFEEALREEEYVWASRKDGDGQCEVCTLAGLVNAALDVRDLDRAGEWAERMGSARWSGETCRVKVARARCSNALFREQAELAAEFAEEFDRSLAATASPATAAAATRLRIRSALLASDFGDPLSPTHPVMQLLRRRVRRGESHADRLDWLRTIFAVRCAALRFAAGVEPRDDLYYAADREVRVADPRSPRVEIDRRSVRAHAVLDRCETHAKALDRAFRCSWRQVQIDRCRERLSRIEKVV